MEVRICEFEFFIIQEVCDFVVNNVEWVSFPYNQESIIIIEFLTTFYAPLIRDFGAYIVFGMSVCLYVCKYINLGHNILNGW